jgi:hypothetical protein
MKLSNVVSVGLLLLALSAPATARAEELRLASPLTGGNPVGSSTPFLIGGTNTERYQQVYSASDFSALPTPGGIISRLGFVGQPGTDTLPNGIYIREIEIRLSTTQRAVDSLSPVFADNVGLNETIVFPRGRMDLRPDPQGGPWIVPFTLPFLYTPSDGNLMMDVRVYQGIAFASGPPPPPVNFECLGWLNPNDTVSQASVHDANATTALAVNTYGLLTYFYATPVPEPGTCALFSIGIRLIFYICRRFHRGSVKNMP